MRIDPHELLEIVHVHAEIAVETHVAKDRRVVDQVIDAPEALHCGVRTGPGRCLACDVGTHEQRAATTGVDLLGNAAAALLAEFGNHHVHAACGAHFCIAFADAAAGTGDDQGFSVEIHGYVLFCG